MDKKGKLSSNSLLTRKLTRLLLFIRTWSTMFLVVKSRRRKSNEQRLTTVIVGKLNRGISVVDTVRILKGDSVTEDDIFKATVLGWLIEFVRSIRNTKMMKLTYFFSCKPSFWSLMTSWMPPSLVVDNLAGTNLLVLVWLLSTTHSFLNPVSISFWKSTLRVLTTMLN